ncbi:MAG: hypothetical protein K2L21_05430 [Muribaculaceae bacterium]|nr:hypothetical protein [Muribaculaceae bacterium]
MQRYGGIHWLYRDLKAEFPEQTGFSSTNIKYIKRWYEFYNQENTNRHQIGDDFELQRIINSIRNEINRARIIASISRIIRNFAA